MEKNDKSRAQDRILYFDPNPRNNVPINVEDLTISVDLYVESKSRSIIAVNGKDATVTTNGSGGINTIKFINGSSYKGGRSLTTKYTEIPSSYSNTSGDDDYEALGIESINIEFNSSYAPLVKIKFIDIRGAAIFARNGKGKYNFFFEMPYPLFHLTIKGYYGQAVEYCLHLTKFNANFNSETGNFEIDCDFIGYTYALLNDMLIGLLRANETTKRGQELFQKIKNSYSDELKPSIITINDLVKKQVDINDLLEKAKAGDSVQQIAATNNLKDKVTEGKTTINTTIEEIAKIAPPINNTTYTNGLLILRGDLTTDEKTKINAIIATNGTSITEITKNIDANNKIPAITQLLDKRNFEFIISDIKIADISNIDTLIATISSQGKYPNPIKNGYLANSLHTLVYPTGVVNVNIYDCSTSIESFNKIDNELTDNLNNTTKDLTDSLSDEISSKLGFQSNIRNLFRILTISCEVFLNSLLNVSKESERSSVRKNALNGYLNNFNLRKNEDIFPWPEYREKGLDGSEYETWLGNKVNVNSVDELKYVEELLKGLMEIYNSDRAIEAGITGNIDGWFPMSAAELPINGLTIQNPYKSALVTDTPHEALRLLGLRAFLFLGINSRNRNDINVTKMMGSLEAENLYAVCKTKSITNAGIIINTINGLTTAQIYEIYKKGSFTMEPKRPLLAEVNKTQLTYVFIQDYKTGQSYIPINNNFDGDKFLDLTKTVSAGYTLKSASEIQSLSNNTLFVSNVSNNTIIKRQNGAYIPDNNDGIKNTEIRVNYDGYDGYDGAVYVKIISSAIYEDTTNSFKVNYGDTEINDNKFKTIKFKRLNVYNSINNPNRYFERNPIGGKYYSTEFTEIDYGTNANKFIGDGITSILGGTEDTSLIAFFSQIEPTTYTSDYIIYNSLYRQNTIPRSNGWVDGKDEFIIDNNVKYSTNEYYYTSRINKNGYDNYGKTRTLIGDLVKKTSTVYLPFIEFTVNNDNKYSLFGSLFYNSQRYKQSKAFLFLHCFPWQGVIREPTNVWSHFMFDYIEGETIKEMSNTENNDTTTTRILGAVIKSPYESNVLGIKGLFRIYGGVVKVPKMWALFIGGILWRSDEYRKKNVDPIDWVDINDKYLVPGMVVFKDNERQPQPRTDEFLHNCGDRFISAGMRFHFKVDAYSEIFKYNKQLDVPVDYDIDYDKGVYSRIDETIMGLPSQVRLEFINYFKNWVDTDFEKIQKELEIDFKTINDYKQKWDTLTGQIDITKAYNTLKKSQVEILGKNIVNNYISVSPVNKYNYYTLNVTSPYNAQKLLEAPELTANPSLLKDTYQFNMELKPDSLGMNLVLDLMKEYVYIQNINPHVWNPPNLMVSPYKDIPRYKDITVNSGDFNTFIEAFKIRFSELSKDYTKQIKDSDDATQTALFNTIDDDKIKLNIYRTLASIYQKWIGGTEGEIFSQCTVNPSDKGISKLERNDGEVTTLIDSFRFLDRSFNDIGDKFIINPINFIKLLNNNYNSSLFQNINKVLSDNNFNFIPLPNFVNFKNHTELRDMFDTYTYKANVSHGPSFVCVYAGQTSTGLDLGESSNYPDDGISINIDDYGTISGLPDDFTTDKNVYNTNIPIFSVNYGQQNQNYFKNIRLDQKEFTETAESLEIINDLSTTADKRKGVPVGQNLFNIYQKRSYSAEIEMMGNAMMQPMMYFQLNNIPMFRGLYLIINVSHNIRPNHMTTTFKGVRVKKAKTPLLTTAEMLMNLLGDINSVSGQVVSGNRGGPNKRSPNLGGYIGSKEAVDAANKFAASKGGFVSKDAQFTVDFLNDVLIGLGIASPNQYQVQFMKSWRQHEGAQATYNPFNTTKDALGARYYSTNVAGVKNYATRAEGLTATIDTLNLKYYKDVIAAIKAITNEDGISKTMVAVNNSPWGSKFEPPVAKSWKTLNNYIWGYVND